MNRILAPVLVVVGVALGQAKALTPVTAARRLPMPVLLPSDLIQAAGVRMEAQVPKPGVVLCGKDPQRPLLWYAPSASRALDDGTVQIWYQRVNKGETGYIDQRTLCLGEIRSGRWTLPALRPAPPAWGGPNNVVMTRSPHQSTWGGFNVFQIIAAHGGLAMLYWDQPGPSGEAVALRAVSRDGTNWKKLPGAVFTEHNDAFCLVRIGNEYVAYQTALEPWPDKPVPDNIGKLKRVITLRTSPDLKTWSRQQPLLAPDAKDARDTEFYLFKVFRYGHGYAGLIMKYYADTTKPGKHSAILRHELAASEDGRTWQRPYRDVALGFWSYADPFLVDGRLHFATWKDGAMVTVAYGHDRLVAVTGEGSFRTPPFLRPKKGIALNADVSQGWIEATLCDRAGDPVRGESPYRIEGIESTSISLPWKHESLPAECVLRIRLGEGAKMFGVAEDALVIPVGQRQLFLDEHVIEKIDGLRSTMHSPEKRGAVIKPDAASDGNRVETYGTVPIWSPEEGLFKLVYMAFPMENNDLIGAALAVSKDGIRWQKPDFGHGVAVRGSTNNNRIFVERALRWGDNALWNVVRDPNDKDASRRYKGLLGCAGRIPVFSGDCIRWTILPGVKIPSSDTSTMTYDEQRRRFLAVLKTFNQYGRAAALSISEDFQHWSRPRLCFSTDDTDQRMALDVVRRRVQDRRYAVPLFVDPEPVPGFKPPKGHIPTWRAECYAFSVFPYEGVYIGLPMIYYPTGQELPRRDNTDGFDLIQLAMSRDLTHWKRLGDRGAFIGPSPVDRGQIGVFDRQQLIPPSRPLVMGDELWFYYTGFKTRVPPFSRNPDGSPRDQATLTAEERADLADGWSAICLAVLRRDGFVSLDAGEKPGTLLTKAFVFGGTKLNVNVDATGGELSVAVLDGGGRAIAVSEPVTGNEPRAMLRWRSGDLASVKGKTVSLCFTLRRARLYSFWCE